MEIINRRAKFDYFIEDTYEAGIVLKGTEIKSIRGGKASIKDSYAIIRGAEVYLVNMFINHYKEGNIFNHEETRSRKLLLHKSEIKKLDNKLKLEGYTLIPLKLYFVHGKAKIELGLCKGKKNFDKRESIKDRDLKREMERKLKYR
ncbi:MAG TPA: SsrA-binding protein SmpB [Candidatus Onthousia faecipullorum]|uniref:SsrA-binding protein n=1 Tax=Candidatus Onthousia faecipullorum TaxID=2840887 RepID=A0A9D1KBD8_9FIRM|nr:SsrA-binding protein SmpB [Candidatus Onthousia faecipullorum]